MLCIWARHTHNAFATGCTACCLCWTELQAVEATGNKVLTWEQMLGMGAAKPVLADPPKPDDLSTIMYTSGTTGGLL